jgi:hypothetical protein
MRALLFALCLLASVRLLAAERSELSVSGFVDTYYAYDSNEPVGDRAFTTQAIRQNEFNLNLAYIALALEKSRTRGRLALQTGTSVYSNYAAERTQSSPLGSMLQHVQEAYAGVRLAENVWLDGGIFLSHIGLESFVSKENWNYTRSLGADYSPYYQSGIRLSYRKDPMWALSLHLLNGWQNILEANTEKALGIQVAYSPSSALSFTYNGFLGKESELRLFNNFIVKARLHERLSLAFSSDFGIQKQSGNGQVAAWFVETLVLQSRLASEWAVGGRVEYFSDPQQAIALTNSPNGFQTWGASVNVDWQPSQETLVRTEIRTLASKDALFPARNGTRTTTTQWVTSLALSF